MLVHRLVDNAISRATLINEKNFGPFQLQNVFAGSSFLPSQNEVRQGGNRDERVPWVKSYA